MGCIGSGTSGKSAAKEAPAVFVGLSLGISEISAGLTVCCLQRSSVISPVLAVTATAGLSSWSLAAHASARFLPTSASVR